MTSITAPLTLIGLIFCALCLVAPKTVANYSREQWLQADVSKRRWKRAFANLVMKQWYPTFIRFYGLFGLVFLLIYLVFLRFSK
jgi:hypothetical protein